MNNRAAGKERKRDEAPLPVAAAMVGDRNIEQVLGLSPRHARALARKHHVRCIVTGSRIVAIDVADFVAKVPRAVGESPAPAESGELELDADLDDEITSGDQVLARLGLRAAGGAR